MWTLWSQQLPYCLMINSLCCPKCNANANWSTMRYFAFEVIDLFIKEITPVHISLQNNGCKSKENLTGEQFVKSTSTWPVDNQTVDLCLLLFIERCKIRCTQCITRYTNLESRADWVKATWIFTKIGRWETSKCICSSISPGLYFGWGILLHLVLVGSRRESRSPRIGSHSV